MNDRFKLRWPLLKDRTNKFIEFVYGDCFVGKPFDPPTKHFGEPQQCTGLRDKNGNLIYEGDILKPNGNTITKEVVYEDGSYWAKDTIYFHDKCHIFQKWINECGYEIIGNIHENKELLDERR